MPHTVGMENKPTRAWTLWLILVALLAWAPGAQAACSGSGLAWSCPAGSNSSDIQTTLNNASDGATLTFAAGTYSWTSWAQFSNAKGATLICASPGACVVNFSGTVLGISSFSGNNTHLYRISGFAFQNNPSSSFVIWFDGNGVMSRIRVDHNSFSNLAEATVCVFFGDTQGIANYYGVIEHNTMSTGTSSMLMHYIGALNPNPPPTPMGTANNMFVEDNTVTIANLTNAGESCSDSWGGAAVVWRHNTTLNCLVAAHGALHAGGPQNWEYYNNVQSLNANSVSQGMADGYRQFHHQGSGEFIAFNNTFQAYSGRSTDVIAMMYYRDEASLAASEGGTVCDGTQSIDGNRLPTTTYHGYPCWHQPGRDFANNLQPLYVWNNKWSDTGAKIDLTMEDYGGYHANHFMADRDYYNAVGSVQTSPNSPFSGATGMGFGPLANRPASCTTNALESGGGVGYFATDVGSQGTLYRCSAPNTWTVHYTPYTYPHPLTLGGVVADATPPARPQGFTLR